MFVELTMVDHYTKNKSELNYSTAKVWVNLSQVLFLKELDSGNTMVYMKGKAIEVKDSIEDIPASKNMMRG